MSAFQSYAEHMADYLELGRGSGTAGSAGSLPEGRLGVPSEGPFLSRVQIEPADVFECAILLDARDEVTTVYSQAGVIAQAGKLCGWGQGDAYQTL